MMRSAALGAARRFCSAGAGAGAVRMPVGATPQILISANGTHKHGAVSKSDLAVSKITSAIVDHGASIAASKKVRLQGRGQASSGNQAVARRQVATT